MVCFYRRFFRDVNWEILAHPWLVYFLNDLDLAENARNVSSLVPISWVCGFASFNVKLSPGLWKLWQRPRKWLRINKIGKKSINETKWAAFCDRLEEGLLEIGRPRLPDSVDSGDGTALIGGRFVTTIRVRIPLSINLAGFSLFQFVLIFFSLLFSKRISYFYFASSHSGKSPFHPSFPINCFECLFGDLPKLSPLCFEPRPSIGRLMTRPDSRTLATLMFHCSSKAVYFFQNFIERDFSNMLDFIFQCKLAKSSFSLKSEGKLRMAGLKKEWRILIFQLKKLFYFCEMNHWLAKSPFYTKIAYL